MNDTQIEIIDINENKRIVSSVYINSNYPEFVECLFPDEHIEWFPIEHFRSLNPNVLLTMIIM
jgi:hypothetical protein